MFDPPRPDRRTPLISWGCSLGSDLCTVVTGPPGGGKTALLTQWYDELERSGDRPVWCSPLAGGNPGPPEGWAIPDGQLAGRTIFVDNADHMESSVIETYLAAMAAGGSGLPSRLVLAARPMPDGVLEWSRHGTVRTVRIEELDSAQDVVKTILLGYQPDVSPDELAVLLSKVGRWPAGAHLAGRAISHQNAEPGAAHRFDGHDLGVSDYLDTEIFGGLDTVDQEFLVTCSVLAQLTPPVCAMLTGDQLAEERLHRLGRQHALVSASAATGSWVWRPLARCFLQTKLSLRSADDVAELRRRVRGWSMARRSYPEAVAQAGETEDWNVIVRLILDVGLDTVASGEGAMVLDWIDSLPAGIRESERGLAMVAVVAIWATLGPEGQPTIDDWLAHASTNPIGRAPGQAPSLAVGIDLIRSLIGIVPPEQQLTLADEAELGTADDDPSWSALRLSAVGFAAYLCDDGRRARQALAECLRRHGPAGEASGWFLQLFGSSIAGLLALTEQEADEHDRAAVLLSMAGLSSTGRPATSTGLVELATARQSWHQGDHDLALELLQTVGRSASILWVRALALLDAAELCRRRGNDSGQAAALAAADRLLVEMQPPPPVLARLRQGLDRHEQQGADTLDDGGLTERELEVLRLLDTDLTRRQIAGQLFLAHNTVKTYIQRLYHKLGVSSRPAAIARARERGWLD